MARVISQYYLLFFGIFLFGSFLFSGWLYIQSKKTWGSEIAKMLLPQHIILATLVMSLLPITMIFIQFNATWLLMLGISALLWLSFIRTFRAIKHREPALLNLGNPNKASLGAIAGALSLAIFRLLTHSSVSLPDKLSALVVELSLVAIALLDWACETSISDRGFHLTMRFFVQLTIAWENIELYEWASQEGMAVLLLKLRQPLPFFNYEFVRMPLNYKTQVDKLLNQRVAQY